MQNNNLEEIIMQKKNLDIITEEIIPITPKDVAEEIKLNLNPTKAPDLI